MNAEAIKALCEARDWLRHSASVTERLIAEEQERWEGEPGRAPEIPLTVAQAQGLAEGLSTASKNVNGAISALLGLPVTVLGDDPAEGAS